MLRLRTILTTLVFTFFANTALASVFEKDGYEIHYSPLNTTFLSPEIAGIYGITRSKTKGLLNIAVLKKTPEGGTQPVTAKVTGQVYDLILTTKLDFQEVKEQYAIYYLASFDFQNKTENYFTIYVQPEQRTGKDPIKVQFNKLLYKE